MRKRLAVAAALSLLVLAGCGGNGTSNRTDDSGDPVLGGRLVYVDPVAINSWQPHLLTGYGYTNLYGAVTGNLIYFDPNKGLVPWLATEWQANEDNTEFTLKLREGVTFSDGSPFNAAIVKANLDQIGLGDKAKGLSPASYIPTYDTTEVIDDYTVKVVFKEPHARFLRLLSTAVLTIVGQSTLDLDAKGQADPKNVVGAGPFVFDSETPGEEIVLTKREGYAWAPETSSNQGEAYIDELVFRFANEPAVRQGALLSGQAHIVRSILSTDEDQVEAQGGTVYPAQGSRSLLSWSLIFRPENPLVSDVRVRHAIAVGFDRQKLIDGVLSDSYVVATSLFGREFDGYVDHSADLKYDPDLSASLLEEAGWTLNSDGVREKDGQELKLTVAGSAQTAESKNVIDFIAQQLAEVGIVLENRAGDQAFSTYAGSSETGVNVPLSAGQAWVQNSLEGRWDRGLLAHTTSDELNGYIWGERTSTTDAQRLDFLAKQQKFLLTDNWWISPIFEDVQVFGAGPAVKNLEFSADLAPNFQSVWLAE